MMLSGLITNFLSPSHPKVSLPRLIRDDEISTMNIHSFMRMNIHLFMKASTHSSVKTNILS